MNGLRVERPSERVALVMLDRPERRNALDDELLLRRLPDVFTELDADQTVGAIVLAGEGGSFCAGADLECSGLSLPTPADSQAYMERSHSVVINIRSTRQPVIAAVEGAAVGAGLGLAAACDIRIAAPSAKFIVPFLKLGLPPDFGCSYLLPRIVGSDVALEMFLTCRSVDGVEAQRIGLATQLSDKPLETALEMAEVISLNPPHAIEQTKRNVYSGLETDIRTAIYSSEIRSVVAALHSDEFRESFAVWKQQITG